MDNRCFPRTKDAVWSVIERRRQRLCNPPRRSQALCSAMRRRNYSVCCSARPSRCWSGTSRAGSSRTCSDQGWVGLGCRSRRGLFPAARPEGAQPSDAACVFRGGRACAGGSAPASGRSARGGFPEGGRDHGRRDAGVRGRRVRRTTEPGALDGVQAGSVACFRPGVPSAAPQSRGRNVAAAPDA
jgi:hypothetical protein